MEEKQTRKRLSVNLAKKKKFRSLSQTTATENYINKKKLQIISLVENLGSWKKKEQGFESG
jgi:hypothetical protein